MKETGRQKKGKTGSAVVMNDDWPRVERGIRAEEEIMRTDRPVSSVSAVEGLQVERHSYSF